MTDLFKKLNTLVKASINNTLGDDHAIGGARNRPLTPEKLGKNIDREIDMLRGRINEALAYEDELAAKVVTLQNEVARWDAQADAAVNANNDVQARYAIEQMQLTQRRLTMAEADLQEHRYVVQELILRVNQLEAAVADTRRAESAQQAESPAAESGRSLSDVLRDARETITTVGESIAARQEPPTTPAENLSEQTPADDQSVADDLERRRQRLSKR